MRQVRGRRRRTTLALIVAGLLAAGALLAGAALVAPPAADVAVPTW